ncbi:MAG: ornithine cyclodeaminase family protein [Alphaproteobacteria bacterium]|nr:ornithine cyclodeaminase family protein [Alphaproteobacteria bacterium]
MLFIHNDVVESILSMRTCIDVQDKAFQAVKTGEATHRPRIDVFAPSESPEEYYRWGSMDGAFGGYFATRMKSDIMRWQKDDAGRATEDKYCVEPGTYCGLIFLFSTRNGAPLALINDGILQHMRVGAGAGLGVRYLARENAKIVGIIGSGGMAETYLEAFLAVRDIQEVRVYSRSPDNREAFARKMGARFGVEISPVDTPEKAVRGADIVASCTNSMTPTLDPAWIEPGMHVTDVNNKEVSDETFARFDISVRQGSDELPMAPHGQFRKGIGKSPGGYVSGTPLEQQRLPAAPVEAKAERSLIQFVDLADGSAPGRQNDEQITYYYNSGFNGLQFAAVGGAVYEACVEQGLGRSLPLEWFLQDVKN